jgi:hypothetical protein
MDVSIVNVLQPLAIPQLETPVAAVMPQLLRRHQVHAHIHILAGLNIGHLHKVRAGHLFRLESLLAFWDKDELDAFTPSHSADVLEAPGLGE